MIWLQHLFKAREGEERKVKDRDRSSDKLNLHFYLENCCIRTVKQKNPSTLMKPERNLSNKHIAGFVHLSGMKSYDLVTRASSQSTVSTLGLNLKVQRKSKAVGVQADDTVLRFVSVFF